MSDYSVVHQGEELYCVMPNGLSEQTNAAQPIKIHLKVLVALPVLRGSIDVNTQLIIIAPSTSDEQSNSSTTTTTVDSVKQSKDKTIELDSDGDSDAANELFVMSRLFGDSVTDISSRDGRPTTLHFNLNVDSSDSDSDTIDDLASLTGKSTITTVPTPVPHRSRGSSATTRRTPPSIPCMAKCLPSTITTRDICTILSATKDIALEDNDYNNIVWANTLAMTRIGLIQGEWVSYIIII
jgi:hypothetical protein